MPRTAHVAVSGERGDRDSLDMQEIVFLSCLYFPPCVFFHTCSLSGSLPLLS